MMQIHHWDRLGLVRPSLRTAEGSGSRRLYSKNDLVEIELIRRLRAADIGLDCLAAALRGLRSLWADVASVTDDGLVLIGFDGSCTRATADSTPHTLLGSNRVGLLIDVAGIVRDLRDRLSSGLPPPARPARTERPAAESPATRPRASAWGADW